MSTKGLSLVACAYSSQDASTPAIVSLLAGGIAGAVEAAATVRHTLNCGINNDNI